MQAFAQYAEDFDPIEEAPRPTCDRCGTPFIPTRAWTKFCSRSCRRLHHLSAYHAAMDTWRRAGRPMPQPEREQSNG